MLSLNLRRTIHVIVQLAGFTETAIVNFRMDPQRWLLKPVGPCSPRGTLMV